MEYYDIIKQISNGDQGPTYMVQQQDSDQALFMKMIECLDESHANNAVRELIQLQEMGSHRLIWDIFDIFVHWDKQVSSVYVCVVGTYIHGENLSVYLEKMTSFKCALPDSTIKRWLAEIVDALLFASNRNINHRNLKPNNILLDDVNDHIVICDFCVPSILADMRSNPRRSVGSLHWIAPELAQSMTSDEPADVWSIGCIVLNMILSGNRDVGHFTDKLELIKFSTTELENLLLLANECVSNDLLSLVRTMLSIDPAVRPTLAQLADDRLIIDGLAAANEARLKRQTNSSPYNPLPVGVTGMQYLKYITDNIDNEVCVAEVFEHLLMMVHSKQTPYYVVTANRIYVLAMTKHEAVESVIVHGFQLLSAHLVLYRRESSILCTVDFLQFLLSTMQRHDKSADVQLAAVTLLSSMAISDEITEAVGHLKCVAQVLKVMKFFNGNCSICSACLKTLWRLIATAGHVRRLVDHKALPDVFEVIKMHKFNSDVIQAGFLLIFSMTLNDENIKVIKELNFLQLIVDTMSEHSSSPKVVKNGCLALAALVAADEETAYCMVTRNPNEIYHSLQKIIEIYFYQCYSLEASLALCSLFNELSCYEDVASEMEYLNIGKKVLDDLLKNFRHNQDIVTKCNHISTNIRNVKPILPVPFKPL